MFPGVGAVFPTIPQAVFISVMACSRRVDDCVLSRGQPSDHGGAVAEAIVRGMSCSRVPPAVEEDRSNLAGCCQISLDTVAQTAITKHNAPSRAA